MIINENVIERIWYSNLFESTLKEACAGDDVIKDFYKEEGVNENSKLGVAIANMASDYASENMRYSFIDGFRLGIILMTEVFGNE